MGGHMWKKQVHWIQNMYGKGAKGAFESKLPPSKVDSALWTRPSALGMSDPILGPLIHISELRRKKLLDQIDYEYAALLF